MIVHSDIHQVLSPSNNRNPLIGLRLKLIETLGQPPGSSSVYIVVLPYQPPYSVEWTLKYKFDGDDWQQMKYFRDAIAFAKRNYKAIAQEDREMRTRRQIAFKSLPLKYGNPFKLTMDRMEKKFGEAPVGSSLHVTSEVCGARKSWFLVYNYRSDVCKHIEYLEKLEGYLTELRQGGIMVRSDFRHDNIESKWQKDRTILIKGNHLTKIVGVQQISETKHGFIYKIALEGYSDPFYVDKSDNLYNDLFFKQQYEFTFNWLHVKPGMAFYYPDAGDILYYICRDRAGNCMFGGSENRSSNGIVTITQPQLLGRRPEFDLFNSKTDRCLQVRVLLGG